MEERARYARGDCYQVALTREDFDLSSAGEFGQIHRTPAADVRRRHFVGSNRREVWEEPAGMHEEFM